MFVQMFGFSIKDRHCWTCRAVERCCSKEHRVKMTQRICLVILLLCLGLMYPLITGIFMDKLASKKMCADDDCVYTISLARAEEDYNAPDCRFINIKKGQLIYVYSKLVKEKESGEFWAGSVYGEQYEDHMGTVGYFPSSLVSEQHVYQVANKTVPTTDIDFFCE
ncbi:otoraplin [Dromaius novaehollandiae]|uniref:Otoraplin n=1 Tax=Dromaius novaehollandiae TaxID=8790 RepID=A0A8C4J2H0_DRONO|nr:otoraplin [Dromaius novaehollandiae]